MVYLNLHLTLPPKPVTETGQEEAITGISCLLPLSLEQKASSLSA